MGVNERHGGKWGILGVNEGKLRFLKSAWRNAQNMSKLLCEAKRKIFRQIKLRRTIFTKYNCEGFFVKWNYEKLFSQNEPQRIFAILFCKNFSKKYSFTILLWKKNFSFHFARFIAFSHWVIENCFNNNNNNNTITHFIHRLLEKYIKWSYSTCLH